MSLLKKIVKTTYVPGSPGMPASPGTPAMPSHTGSTTVTGPVDAAQNYTFVLNQNPNRPPGYIAIPKTNIKPIATIVPVVYPATPATPPFAGIPPTPSSLLYDNQMGWNSGARAVHVLDGNGYATFTIPSSSTGVVVGFSYSDAKNEYKAIDYAFHASHGLLDIYSRGVHIGVSVPYGGSEILKIQRNGGRMEFYKNGIPLLLVPTTIVSPLVLNAALYTAGDAVDAAALFSTVVIAQSGADVTMEPLEVYSYDGSYNVSAARMSPLTSTSGGHQLVVMSTTMEPLFSVSSNYEYSYSTATFEPLTAEASSGGLIPVYAIVDTPMVYMTSASYGLTGEIGSADVAMKPMISLSADHAYGEVRGDMLPLDGYSGEYTTINAFFQGSLGKFSLEANGKAIAPNSFYGVGKFSFYGAFGGYAKMALPPLSFTASATSTGVGAALMVMPMPTLTASGFVGNVGKFNKTLISNFKISAYSGAVLRVTLQDGFSMQASGLSGAVGSIIVEMPLFELVASGRVDDYGTAVLAMPMLQPVPSGIAKLIGPHFTLVAVGYADVEITYEAYAANLLTGLDRSEIQTDPDVAEVTHYTNYPFNQIVRFGGEYYGVAGNGLYQLGGDLDHEDQISWSFRTALTDFGSKQFKRVRSVYIGGRLTMQVLVNLIVGEEQEIIYNYVTPRGTNAQNYRVLFGKGVRTRYVALEMYDQAGRFFSIDSLDFENDILDRAL